MNRSRRQFIETVLAGGFWFLGGKAFAGQSQRVFDSNRKAMLTGMLAHTESARVIGRAYLNTHPNLADREILEGMLRDPSTRVPRRVDPPDLHSRIIAQVRTDYEFGRVVILNGWILSDTEAKLCALLSLP